MSEDHLLDDSILVPQTQPSPHSFSTQLVKRLRIKSFTNRRGDAVNPNTNNTYYYYNHIDEALGLEDPCRNNFRNLTTVGILQLFRNI